MGIVFTWRKPALNQLVIVNVHLDFRSATVLTNGLRFVRKKTYGNRVCYGHIYDVTQYINTAMGHMLKTFSVS